MDLLIYIWCCCCSVARSCLTPCDPMDYSTPGFPVLHYLLHFAQTHVHWAVTSSNHLILCHHLLLLPSIFSQHQGLFPWVGSSIRWPRYWIFSFSISPSSEYKGLIIFGLTGLTSLQSNRLSRVFSSTTLGKHQFFGAQPSLWFSFYSSMIHMWVLKLEMHSGPNEMSCMCKRHSGFQRQYKILVGLTNNTL